MLSFHLMHLENEEVQALVSLSWAGYVAASDFSDPEPQIIGVNASWIIPTINVTSKDTYSSAWIGIGGQFDKTLIQIGTEHDLINGNKKFQAWFDLLPKSAEPILMNISEGDKIQASIELKNSEKNQWLLQIMDLSNGESYCQDFFYNSTRLSADWIVERPLVGSQLTALTDFGKITFSDAYVNLNHDVLPIGEAYFWEVQMSDILSTKLASVSLVSEDGKSFGVQFIQSGLP